MGWPSEWPVQDLSPDLMDQEKLEKVKLILVIKLDMVISAKENEIQKSTWYNQGSTDKLSNLG